MMSSDDVTGPYPGATEEGVDSDAYPDTDAQFGVTGSDDDAYPDTNAQFGGGDDAYPDTDGQFAAMRINST